MFLLFKLFHDYITVLLFNYGDILYIVSVFRRPKRKTLHHCSQRGSHPCCQIADLIVLITQVTLATGEKYQPISASLILAVMSCVSLDVSLKTL